MFRAHIIIGNIKSSITGIYHGITKREMPLFLNEQEYTFNHRKIGKTVMDKIKEYLQRSFPISHRQIVYILSVFASDSSLKSSPVDYGYSKSILINILKIIDTIYI